MRACIVITALMMFTCIASAQTSISGTVNSYYKVLGIKTTASGLKLDNVSGLAVNDRVMIVQMKGAAVNTTNTSSFGLVNSYNEAGYYELATICAIRSDSVFLLQQLLRTYNVANKVQLVRIPVYTAALVTDSLKASPWDSTTGKGGVLALIVSGTLSLQAPVSATGKGFKGGSFYKDAGGCANNAFTSYFYNPTPGSYLFYSDVQFGAYKGESIADLPLSQRAGKGSCANGGGGGNNHNNGGGGGSNLAGGGKGGDNTSTVGCTGQHAGLGGYTLNNSTNTRIFFGGGGGAGHANNTVVSAGGGNGGGLVFIQAQSLTSNGYTVSANGLAGGNTNGDGASGGGGGGTLILTVTNYTDAVSLEAKGGNGGQVDDELISGRCYGEGGGGSGGVIYFSGLPPAGSVSLSGGAKGAKINSTCGTSTGAGGTAGISVSNYSYMESSALSGCSLILPNSAASFQASVTGSHVVLKWKLTDPLMTSLQLERRSNQDRWDVITQLKKDSASGEQVYTDRSLLAGYYEYRLKWVSEERSHYSVVRAVIIKNAAEMIFSPSRQTIWVNHMLHPNELLQVFDASGACVLQKRFTAPSFQYPQDVSFLKPGTYIACTDRARIRFVKD